MRGGLLVLLCTLMLGVGGAACSGGEDGADVRTVEGESARDRTAKTGEATVEDGLGHQAFQPSTRLVVPSAEGMPLDRAARVLAGLSEGPLGTRLFVDQRPDQNGELAWRDVADEEPDGHQLAYVTEELLAADGTGPGEMTTGDFEMAAQTDVGFAVLIAKGDPEVETLQWQDFEDFGDFVEAAKEEPGLVEVADPGADTVYRAGTLTLEREAGVDLLPRSPANKTPIQAIYDADVEAALVPLEAVVLSDVLAGELEALAVFDEGRCPDLPGVPTAKDLGYDVTVPVFGGIAAPAGAAPREVDEIGAAFVARSFFRNFERALAGSGRVPMQRGSGEFARYVEEQSRFLSETVSGATKGE